MKIYYEQARGNTSGIGRCARCLLEQLKQIPGVEFVELKAQKKTSRIGWIAKIVRRLSFITLGIRIRRHHVDVFFSSTTRIPPFLPRRILKVVILHDCVYKLYPSTMHWSIRLLNTIEFPHALSRATAIITVSQSALDDLRQWYPQYANKATAILLASTLPMTPVDDAIAQLQRRAVLVVGSWEPRKNHARIIEAYAGLSHSLRARHPLVFIGGDSWGNVSLTDLCAQYGISEHCQIHYQVTDEVLVSQYQQAMCLLMPSLYEGFGLPILEAQQYSVPCVVSNTSSMPEVVGEGGICVDPLSVEAIRDGLERLLTDSSLWQQLSIAAKANAMQYSWAKTAQQVYECIQSQLPQLQARSPSGERD